jgi:hypothetical protein
MASPRATAPRRGVYDSMTLATVRTSTGVPPALARTTVFSMSLVLRR